MKTTLWAVLILAAASMTIASPTYQIGMDAGGWYDYVAEAVTPVGMYEQGEFFRTFCLERNEDIADGVYSAEINTAAVNGGISGGNPDPLSIETAYLYDSFLKGDLASIGFDYNSAESLKRMQSAVWTLEGEGTIYGMGDTLYAALMNYATSTTWTDLGGIRVLNMYDANGGLKQDMLVRVIPAPGAIVLASFGASLVGWLRRRKVA